MAKENITHVTDMKVTKLTTPINDESIDESNNESKDESNDESNDESIEKSNHKSQMKDYVIENQSKETNQRLLLRLTISDEKFDEVSIQGANKCVDPQNQFPSIIQFH